MFFLQALLVTSRCRRRKWCCRAASCSGSVQHELVACLEPVTVNVLLDTDGCRLRAAREVDEGAAPAQRGTATENIHGRRVRERVEGALLDDGTTALRICHAVDSLSLAIRQPARIGRTNDRGDLDECVGSRNLLEGNTVDRPRDCVSAVCVRHDELEVIGTVEGEVPVHRVSTCREVHGPLNVDVRDFAGAVAVARRVAIDVHAKGTSSTDILW